ncbi:MAG: Nif3-like dinuclear metal center hexameric protein [Melioribacteraceae bacterium]|nr:Nif3-like dinuclear metal center hexameric protein [Melioribacteraceae bacterium]MCF8354882.1 Nif3-like dinuclear metal center hexameric protein [Melioribacteraceae bacterium]MCF8393896.1 Nif3-like dinuclear metal center hexameric protein [Melioribacteraceae bacterium]MCF8419668.1 Nif3-like dinuclear metal center hexameric protein [Melioribacteraceae bacterium]
MTGIDLINMIEEWAPPGVAWDKDNVGLQVGSLRRKVQNIMLSLELNDKVLEQALNKNCNFIFTHHPFLFTPLKRIDTDRDEKSDLIEKLIKNDITLYSAHTNLDFTKDGVSFELAKTLKLTDIDFLVNEDSSQVKLVVFVPQTHIEKLSDEIFKAGGGIIGEYNKCSFRVEGNGTFEGSENTDPAVGNKLNFEVVEEVRLEVLVDKWNLQKVLSTMYKAHPYEEPAYDIYPLRNKNVNYGFGAIGNLAQSMKPDEFMNHVCLSLKTSNLRFTKGRSNKIKKVAVCGGSGSDLLKSAIASGADAFVTADVKYHAFQDAENKILYIDAGHYETEIHALNIVKKKIDSLISERKQKIKVYKYTGSTNPVKFFTK